MLILDGQQGRSDAGDPRSTHLEIERDGLWKPPGGEG